jgi:hypothetical protein
VSDGDRVRAPKSCSNANRPVDVATTDHLTPVLAFFTVTDAPATLAPIGLLAARIDASTVRARRAIVSARQRGRESK